MEISKKSCHLRSITAMAVRGFALVIVGLAYFINANGAMPQYQNQYPNQSYPNLQLNQSYLNPQLNQSYPNQSYPNQSYPNQSYQNPQPSQQTGQSLRGSSAQRGLNFYASESGTETETETNSESESETETETETETNSESETETETNSESESETETETETETNSESESETETNSESETETESFHKTNHNKKKTYERIETGVRRAVEAKKEMVDTATDMDGYDVFVEKSVFDHNLNKSAKDKDNDINEFSKNTVVATTGVHGNNVVLPDEKKVNVIVAVKPRANVNVKQNGTGCVKKRLVKTNAKQKLEAEKNRAALLKEFKSSKKKHLKEKNRPLAVILDVIKYILNDDFYKKEVSKKIGDDANFGVNGLSKENIEDYKKVLDYNDCCYCLLLQYKDFSYVEEYLLEKAAEFCRIERNACQDN